MKKNFTYIVQQCLQGDQEYQSILYDLFCDMVMGICTRYAASNLQADDLFQDSFLKIFQNLTQLKDPEALPGWIKRTTINLCLTAIRDNKSFSSASIENPETDDGQYTELLDRLSNDQLIELINELPAGNRAVLNLYIIDGYSHKEVAEILKITESTSRSQLTYDKKLLKKRLLQLGIGRYESVI